MKKVFILFFLSTLLVGCTNKKPTPSELVTEYYDAFNVSDFNRLTRVIADSVTIIEGE
ncbi:MAG: hypothetical protein KI790_20080 [Cyclobacteriaceae bacterium]|nr:hypothetical protein [Cyclobacteriaceae bacterium HetDA_MAG_MS6]